MAGASGPGMGSIPAGEPERYDDAMVARFHEFCAARLTDALLSLSPDEIFLLSQGEFQDETVPSWDERVRRATVRLARRLPLPSLDEFVEAYREDPQRFEAESLGLWSRGAGKVGSSSP
jgi:hypothetical protein